MKNKLFGKDRFRKNLVLEEIARLRPATMPRWKFATVTMRDADAPWSSTNIPAQETNTGGCAEMVSAVRGQRPSVVAGSGPLRRTGPAGGRPFSATFGNTVFQLNNCYTVEIK